MSRDDRPETAPGFGNWVLERRACFLFNEMGSGYTRYPWRWLARLNGWLYLTLNLFPGRLDARVFYARRDSDAQNTREQSDG